MARWPRVALALAALCGTPAVSVSAQAVRDLPAADRNIDPRIEELFRVGGADAPDWASFARVSALAFDPAGNLYIADVRTNTVVLVDRQGRFLRNVGREGDGPGEFRAPSRLAVDRTGRLVVWDLLRDLYQLFAPDGDFLFAVREAGELSGPAGIAFLEDSVLFAPARPFRVNGETVVLTGGDARPARDIPLYRVPLVSGRLPRRIGAAWLEPRPRAADPVTPHAFATTFSWAVRHDRIALADTVDYTVRILDPLGSPVVRIRRPIPPRSPSRADREHARSEARARLIDPQGRPRIAGASTSGAPTGAATAQRVERALDAMTFADRVPVLRGLAFDGEGRLWIERVGPVWGQPGPIDLVSPDGNYLGTIDAARTRLPAAFGPGGLAAFIELDALHVPTVVVRRITLPRS